MGNGLAKSAPFAVILSLLGVGIVEAPIIPVDLQTLKAAKSLKCTFTATVAAMPDKPWPSPIVRQDSMITQFDSIDHAKGSARIIGNLSAGDVAVGSNDAGVYFIEIAPSNVTLTFVFASGLQDARKFKAAQARNLAMLGARPSNGGDKDHFGKVGA